MKQVRSRVSSVPPKQVDVLHLKTRHHVSLTVVKLLTLESYMSKD